MKLRRTLVLASLSAALCVMALAPALAQERLNARQVAALVQSFYDQSTSFTADFRQQQYTKVHDRTERAHGRVVFEKPGKMRWDYAAPNGQVFVSDGQTLLVYQPPDEGERHGQLIERPMSEHQLPQAFSFLTGTGRLLKRTRNLAFAEGRVMADDRLVLRVSGILKIPSRPLVPADRLPAGERQPPEAVPNDDGPPAAAVAS